MEMAEQIAREKHSGHFTMMRFTTGWKIFIGTPDLDGLSERERIWNMPIFPTVEEALSHFIVNN